MAASVVCVTEIEDPSWRWIQDRVTRWGLTWRFARAVPTNALERLIRRPNLACIRAGFQAAWMARSPGATCLVVHGPRLLFWCILFAKLLGVRPQILAHSFNLNELPSRAKQKLYAIAFAGIERFVVYSTLERDVYARAFGLSLERIEVVLWGVQPPLPSHPDRALVAGDYVCAIGGNARDYGTLVACARLLPDVPFVLVVRPENLRGLELPPNIQVHVNMPGPDTMNVLVHSRFMVLPLDGSEVPCGHVTIVAAMHLGRAIVATDSAGIGDYLRHGDNALLVPPREPEAMAAAVRRLWDDRALCDGLARSGQAFARARCTEDICVEHFEAWLSSRGFQPAEGSQSARGLESAI